MGLVLQLFWWLAMNIQLPLKRQPWRSPPYSIMQVWLGFVYDWNHLA